LSCSHASRAIASIAAAATSAALPWIGVLMAARSARERSNARELLIAGRRLRRRPSMVLT
jgi:hypothetical protein